MRAQRVDHTLLPVLQSAAARLAELEYFAGQEAHELVGQAHEYSPTAKVQALWLWDLREPLTPSPGEQQQQPAR